ncbi:MAG: Glycine cleavage system H protein [uncultured Thiotrichaceae bacterium]|uniref:Glycine cleavage system H protein n=1 Tax=uncultured Thiotrichaceae bacterium TaxID=298394 RepID=A0A6S6SIZ5_9GAMM|nr:MAG: Glycine cleavage system H protein [uncultured Thiotrichaceae bacterium]
MSHIPDELRYSVSHEWVRDNEDGTVTVGISDHAQALLGDLVHIELPDVDAEFGREDGIAVAESVKAASDIYSPMEGRVTEVNEAVLDSPELVNSDPYGDGWLFIMEVEDIDMLAALMDAETYSDILEAAAEEAEDY